MTLKKFSPEEINEFKNTAADGLTNEEKQKLKNMVYSRFTNDEIAKIKEMYEKYKDK